MHTVCSCSYATHMQLLVSYCIHAAHNHFTHCAHFADVCRPHLLVCGTSVAQVQLMQHICNKKMNVFVSSTYAACKFNTCRKVANMYAAQKQHFCKGTYIPHIIYVCNRQPQKEHYLLVLAYLSPLTAKFLQQF